MLKLSWSAFAVVLSGIYLAISANNNSNQLLRENRFSQKPYLKEDKRSPLQISKFELYEN